MSNPSDNFEIKFLFVRPFKKRDGQTLTTVIKFGLYSSLRI